MEFGPIFRALLRNRTRTWLIVLEVALTFAVVVNCLALIEDQRGQIDRPTGLDEEHLISVVSLPFDPAFEEDDHVRAVHDQDLRVLRELPGVRAATALTAVPLSGGGSATGVRIADSEDESTTMPFFSVSPDAVETFGVEIVAGRDLQPSDWVDPENDGDVSERNVLLTRKAADQLFPDGDAVGKLLESGTGGIRYTIVGVLERMHNSWPQSQFGEVTMLIPGFPSGPRRSILMVRAEPGHTDRLVRSLEGVLTDAEPGRIVQVSALSEIKSDTYRGLTSTNQLLIWVSGLLIAVTTLGIVGLTSFSVTQRRRQIGTRRALGATRFAILRLFLVESWLITGIGLALGLVLAYGLNFGLASMGGVPRVGLPLVLAGVAGMWIVGLLGALAPALRSTMVQPVVATRSI